MFFLHTQVVGWWNSQSWASTWSVQHGEPTDSVEMAGRRIIRVCYSRVFIRSRPPWSADTMGTKTKRWHSCWGWSQRIRLMLMVSHDPVPDFTLLTNIFSALYFLCAIFAAFYWLIVNVRLIILLPWIVRGLVKPTIWRENVIFSWKGGGSSKRKSRKCV